MVTNALSKLQKKHEILEEKHNRLQLAYEDVIYRLEALEKGKEDTSSFSEKEERKEEKPEPSPQPSVVAKKKEDPLQPLYLQVCFITSTSLRLIWSPGKGADPSSVLHGIRDNLNATKSTPFQWTKDGHIHQFSFDNLKPRSLHQYLLAAYDTVAKKSAFCPPLDVVIPPPG